MNSQQIKRMAKEVQLQQTKTGECLKDKSQLISQPSFVLILLVFNCSNLSGARRRGRGPSFKLGGVSVNAKGLLAAEKELEALDLALPTDETERAKWLIDNRVKRANFDVDWDVEDDSKLLRVLFVLYIYIYTY